MATNKEKLVKGVYFLAVAFPLIFAGPILYTWKGADGFRDSSKLGLTALSIAIMLLAVILVVKGLRTILSSLFDQDSK
jgi:hypothetical protein